MMLNVLDRMMSVKNNHAFRPRLETLEGRDAPAVGPIFHVNTGTNLYQVNSDAAYSSGGKSVVVWQSSAPAGDYDIYAQMFAADGSKLGRQFPVATGSHNQINPSVCIDSRGIVAVAWDDYVAKYTPGNVRMRRFTAPGVAWGDIIDVAATSANERDASISCIDKAGSASDGAFVVSYTKYSRIDAKMYSRWGILQKSYIDLAGTQSSRALERTSVAARAANGSFLIGYVTGFVNEGYRDKSTGYFYGRSVFVINRYDAAGNLLGRTNAEVAAGAIVTHDLAVDENGVGRFVALTLNRDPRLTPIGIFLETGRVSVTGQVIQHQQILQFPDPPFTEFLDPIRVSVAANRVGSGFALAFVHRVNPTSKVPTLDLYTVTNGGVLTKTDLGINHDQASLKMGPNNRYLISYTTTVPTPVDPYKGIFARFGML